MRAIVRAYASGSAMGLLEYFSDSLFYMRTSLFASKAILADVGGDR